MDNMQLWLSSSTDSINLNDSAEGFYLNPDLEGLTGLPEIRSVNGLNAGYDGGWTATQLWAARLITIRGIIAINNKAAVEDKRKALAKILSQGKNEDLELKFVSEAGNTYTTTVRTSYCTMALQRVFWRQEYQIQLRANDPLIYDDGGSELIAILRVMAGEGGFEIPFDIPFDIGGSITPTSIDVGDEATYPLIRLKGDLHSPTIINMTTNQRMQVLADIITTIEWHDYTTTYTTNGYAQIGNGLDGAPLSLTNLYGNATQETLSGKNLAVGDSPDTPDANYSSGGGGSQAVQYSSAEKGYYTTTNRARIFTINDSATYTISVDLKLRDASVSNHGWLIYPYDSTTQTQGSQLGYIARPASTTAFTRGSFTFSLPTGYDSIRVLFYGSIYFNDIQLEKNSEATTYEPYCGGIPSPNPSYPQDVNVVTGRQEVQLHNKNFFEKIFAANKTMNGVDMIVSADKKTLTLDGQTTSAGMVYIVPIMENESGLFKAGTYTFSLSQFPTMGNFRVETYTAPSGGTKTHTLDSTRGSRTFTFTLPEDCYLRLSLIVWTNQAGHEFDDYIITNFQLERNNSETSFESYQVQKFELNLGKNMSTIESYSSIGWATDKTDFKDILNSLPEGTYTFSATWTLTERNSTSNPDIYGIAFSNTGGNLSTTKSWGSSSVGDSKTLTSTFKIDGPRVGAFTHAYFYGCGSNSDGRTGYANITKIQLEAGYVASPWSPYKTPIELAKIPDTNYKDAFKVVDGVWYKHAEIGKVVLDGSEAWVYNSANAVFNIPNLIDYQRDGTAPMSDYFTGQSNVEGYIQTIDQHIALLKSTVSNRLIIKYTAIGTDASDLQTWLSTHNTTVYYALATPTDTEITDSELIEQLNHIYSLYGGVNNLWLIPSAGAQGEMTVSYATAEDIDYHEVVIDCQARTVTQDGHNLYPALAEGSEFIRLVPGENKLYLTSEVESDNGTAEVKFKKGNISI